MPQIPLCNKLHAGKFKNIPCVARDTYSVDIAHRVRVFKNGCKPPATLKQPYLLGLS